MKSILNIAFAFFAAFAILTWQSSSAWAKHGQGNGHGHGRGHHGHGHGHRGHGHGHRGHGHRHHGHGHGHHGHGHGHGHHHFDFHLGHNHWGHHHHWGHNHLYEWPYVDPYYYDSYSVDPGLYYDQPRTYVTSPNTYVVSKPIAVEFGDFTQVDDISGRLELLANELCLDLHYNYQDNPGYAETYRAAYQILDTAKYIYAKEHQGDRDEIARRVQELDPLFRQVQTEISQWSRNHSRQIGQGGAMAKADGIETLLHHLMNNVGVRPHSSDPAVNDLESPRLEAAPPPQNEAETLPPPARPE